MAHSVATARRVLIALLAAVSLLLAGMPAAQAQTATSISGRVVLAPGTESVTSYRVEAYRKSDSGSWQSGSSANLAADGSFTLNYLESDSVYRLRVSPWVGPYLEGYFGPSGTYAPTIDRAADVPVGTSNLVITPLKGATLSGKLVVPESIFLPSSFTFDLWRLGSDGGLLWDGRTGAHEIDRTFSFEFDEVFPGAPHILGIRGHTSTEPLQLFYSTAGLTTSAALATPVFAGTPLTIVASETLIKPPVTVTTAPTVTGRAAVGQKLSVSSGAWSPEDVQLSFQWLRDGKDVPGATANEYSVTREDRGSTLAVRVTASRFDHAPTSRTVTAGKVPLDPAARARKAPQVKGTVRLGSTLRATAGTWDVAGVATTFQWLRSGKKIKGATGARYTLTTKDVGKKISVRVTAKRAGHAEGSALSKATKKVAKGKARVTVTAKSVKRGVRPKVSVKVKVAGLAKPLGSLSVRFGSKTVKAKLAAKHKGALSVRLPALSRGSYRVKVSFTPTGSSKRYVSKATSTSITLKVR